jgi:chorismate synthase
MCTLRCQSCNQRYITNNKRFNAYNRQVGFKSVATIGKAQQTATYSGEAGVLEAKGRHDPCVLPRAVPIVESMANLVVMDLLLAQLARKAAADRLSSAGIPPILKGKLN